MALCRDTASRRDVDGKTDDALALDDQLQHRYQRRVGNQ